MKLNFFCFTLLASALQAGALTGDEEASGTSVRPTVAAAEIVAKNPVNGAEIKAILGDDDASQAVAPPHNDDETNGGQYRLLQTSSVERLSPLTGETIGADHSFRASASDPQGVNRVVFRILFPDSVTTLDFDASLVSSGVYQVDLAGFQDGNWAWRVFVQDRFGNWAYSTYLPFTVDVTGGNGGGGGGGGNDIVAGLQPSCNNNDGSTYNICLDLEGPSGGFEPWMADFGEALGTWENVIVGDLGEIPSSLLSAAFTCTQYPATIDDLYICGASNVIDGPGRTLGFARPLYRRTGSLLPISGEMVFDSADIDSMRADGTFVGILEHEMGHVLGIGTLWEDKGLYDGSSGRYASGTQAEREWRNIGCSGPLPVELEGGPGTAGGHWDETCLDHELMTGFRTGGTPLSRITVGSLADLGYTVDMGAAETYGLADLGSCGSFCPAASRRRHLREPAHLIASSKIGAPPRKLSDKGTAEAKAYAEVELGKFKPTQPMDLPDGVESVGDKFIEVFYEEDGNIHGVRFTSDDF